MAATRKGSAGGKSAAKKPAAAGRVKAATKKTTKVR